MPTNRGRIRATLQTEPVTVDETPLTEANGPVGTPRPAGPEPTAHLYTSLRITDSAPSVNMVAVYQTPSGNVEPATLPQVPVAYYTSQQFTESSITHQRPMTNRTKTLLDYIARYKIPNKANGALDSDKIREALTGHSFRVRLHRDLVEKWHHLYTDRLDRVVAFKLEKTTVYKNGQKLSQTHWVSGGIIYNPNLTDPETQSQMQLEIPENSLFSPESLVNILENRYIFA